MSVKIERPLFMDPALPLERPTLPADFGVGSLVLVIEPRYRRVQSDPISAVVTDKARIWITVKTEVKPWPYRVYRLRLDDQSDGTGNHYAYRFRTPQQHAWEQAQEAAWRYLGKQGIRLDHSSPWRGREVILARALWLADKVEQGHPS